MHTLHKESDFTATDKFTSGGVTYPKGFPLCIYLHKPHNVRFIMKYDGPFVFLKNADYYRKLLSIGTPDAQAQKLSGYRPPAPVVPVLPLPLPKPLTIFPKPLNVVAPRPLPSNITPPKQTLHIPKPITIPNNMAKKAKNTAAPAATTTEQPAAPAPAPAPVAPPAPAAAPVAPAPPVAAPAAPAPAAVPPVETPAAPAAPAAPKEPQQNGVTRPAANTTTRRVWDTADAITTQNGGTPATRKSVVDACVALGVNSSTATTQFGKWCKFHGHVADRSPGRGASTTTTAAQAPVPAPAPAPVAPAAPTQAFTAGHAAYMSTAAGTPVGNPYTEGTPEAIQFAEGWNAAYQELLAQQPSQTAEPTV